MNHLNRCVLGILVFLAFPAGAVATESLSIPRVHHPPVLADFVKVQAEPAAHAAGMQLVERLVQRVPHDGAPVSERTQVYIGYDEDHLYAVFVCFDATPSAVRGQLAGRERIPEDDDAVAMQLDTFGDRKNAYTFQVSAAGVQRDGIWSEAAGAWDFSFDAIWQAESARTAVGYVVLITVPFNSLRFPPRDEQVWGLFFFREIPRKNELATWPAYSTRVAGRLTQAATATGIRGLTIPRSVQLTPYATTHAVRGGLQDGGFHRPEAGLDGKWIVRNSYVVDATVNPDFSQIESDEPQVTGNERFEKLFPEKRLFFLENASYFRTPIPLLFTRRVADPSVGVRVTGRQGPYSVAALVVDDESPGSAGGDARALLVVGRGTRNIGRDGSVGMFVSNHERQGQANRLAAIDGRFAIGAQWTGTWQAAASTSESGARLSSAGPAYSASLRRAGRSLTYAADWHDRSEGFRADTGFVPRTNFRSLDQSLSYRFRGSSGPLVAWGPDLMSAYAWTRDGLRLDAALTPRLTFEWTGPIASGARRRRASGGGSSSRSCRTRFCSKQARVGQKFTFDPFPTSLRVREARASARSPIDSPQDSRRCARHDGRGSRWLQDWPRMRPQRLSRRAAIPCGAQPLYSWRSFPLESDGVLARRGAGRRCRGRREADSRGAPGLQPSRSHARPAAETPHRLRRSTRAETAL